MKSENAELRKSGQRAAQAWHDSWRKPDSGAHFGARSLYSFLKPHCDSSLELEPVAGFEQVLTVSGNLGLQPESFRFKKLQQFAFLFSDNKGLATNFNYYFSFRSLFLQCGAT
jgi:hypothetical protein